MPLPPWDGGTTSLSMRQIADEFGGPDPLLMSNYYAGGPNVPPGTVGDFGPIPSAGEISIQQFYGSSNVPPLPTPFTLYNETSVVPGSPANWLNLGAGGAPYSFTLQAGGGGFVGTGIHAATGFTVLQAGAAPTAGLRPSANNLIIASPFTVFLVFNTQFPPVAGNPFTIFDTYLLQPGTVSMTLQPFLGSSNPRMTQGASQLAPTGGIVASQTYLASIGCHGDASSFLRLTTFLEAIGSMGVDNWGFATLFVNQSSLNPANFTQLCELRTYTGILAPGDAAAIENELIAKWQIPI